MNTIKKMILFLIAGTGYAITTDRNGPAIWCFVAIMFWMLGSIFIECIRNEK
jgi:hypothetical protein